ncbi:MAG: hypothetical protein HY880_02240 [Deltaproteobacteria bacterium]|nr:hypothetical protein [Deltaproteobacteria bacterium]
MKNKMICHSCGKELHDGSLKYVLEIRSFADFDGYLEDYDGDIEDGINDILDAIENMDEQALEDDVYHSVVYLLCKDCREKFTRNPLKSLGVPCETEEVKGTIH